MKRAGKCLILLLLPLFFVSLKSEVAKGEEPNLSVTLSFNGVEERYAFSPLLEPDFTITNEFHDRRINAPYPEQIECIERSLSQGASPKSAVLYTLPLLEKTVNAFLVKVNETARDATLRFAPYGSPMFTINRESEGYLVNEQRLYYDIYLALKYNPDATVTAKAEVLSPAVKAEELIKYTALRSRFSTDYSASNENRKHNVRLALSKINGKRIEKGEEFSFNATVGKRTVANGFSEAKIIVDGEYVDGTGGGVCQASTTLYNCALLSDMKITSVRAHSLAPSYVPPSFDAMVNSGTSDLKFINDSNGPIFIKAYGTADKAVVEIYGEKLPYEIRRESTIVSKTAVPNDKTVIDESGEYDTANLLDGESKRVRWGVAGVSSEGYLCYFEQGKLINKKLIRRDAYRPVQGLIAVKPQSVA